MNSVTCFSGQPLSSGARSIAVLSTDRRGPFTGGSSRPPPSPETARRARRTPRPPRPSPGGRAGQAADLLDVFEVAGRQRVGFAAAVEAEALDGPGADLRDREQPPVAGGLLGRDPAGGDLAGDAGERDRAFRREPEPLQFGRRAAADQRRRAARREGRRRGPASRGAPAADDAPLDQAARPLSISCSQTAQASASQGHGRRSGRRWGQRRSSGPSSGSRAEAAEEVGEVVVDRRARSASAGPPAPARSAPAGPQLGPRRRAR